MPASHRVNVSPKVISWAVTYSRREDYLRSKYPKLADWESGTTQPTYKQLRNFAKDARVAHGYLYLSEPPTINADIPDMRTVGSTPVNNPSPDLVQTIFACQRRQNWAIEHADSNGLVELPLVGSFQVSDSPEAAAAEMRRVLSFGTDQRSAITRRDYRKALADAAEAADILVMVSGIVGNDTSRPLDIEEFRGFALGDALVPVVFVNANDSVGAQIFTLAHELAHIWLGQSAISAPDGPADPSNESERWCNAAAAEFLVPIKELRQVLHTGDPIKSLDSLGRHFKVSDQVLLRRLDSARIIDRQTYRREYQLAVTRARRSSAKASGGGNFYANLVTRVSRRFAESVYWHAKSGETLSLDAYRLLGIKSGEMLDKLGEHMGLRF